MVTIVTQDDNTPEGVEIETTPSTDAEVKIAEIEAETRLEVVELTEAANLEHHQIDAAVELARIEAQTNENEQWQTINQKLTDLALALEQHRQETAERFLALTTPAPLDVVAVVPEKTETPEPVEAPVVDQTPPVKPEEQKKSPRFKLL